MKSVKHILLYFSLLVSIGTQAQEIPTDTWNNADSLRLEYEFRLYGQTRRYAMCIYQSDEIGIQTDWTIFSYQKWLKGSYLISPKGLREGTQLSFKQPQNGAVERLTDEETFGFISVAAFDELTQKGSFAYSQTTYRLKEKQQFRIGEQALEVYHVVADIDLTEMWIWDNRRLPLICQIEKNALEIDFRIEGISLSRKRGVER